MIHCRKRRGGRTACVIIGRGSWNLLVVSLLAAHLLSSVNFPRTTATVHRDEVPLVPSWQKPPQTTVPMTPTLSSQARVYPRPASYTVVSNKNGDTTLRLLADVRIPDGVGELNWPMYVPPVFSDGHAFLTDLRNLDRLSTSSARIRFGGSNDVRIVSFGIDGQSDSLVATFVSSNRTDTDHIRWTLVRNEASVVGSGTVQTSTMGETIAIDFDSEIGGSFRSSEASAAYNLTVIEEDASDNDLGNAVSSSINVVGDSQIELLMFGVNAEGYLEAEWRLADAVDGRCRYTLRRGSEILASAVSSAGDTGVVFNNLDLVDEHGSRRRRLQYSPPSENPEASLPLSINHSSSSIVRQIDEEERHRFDDARVAEIALEKAMAASGLSVYDIYYQLRPSHVQTAPAQSRFGKIAVLEDDVDGLGSLYSLASPQGSAAAATVMGYTFHRLGENNDNAAEGVATNTSSSSSSSSNSSAMYGLLYTIDVAELDAVDDDILRSTATATISFDVDLNATTSTGNIGNYARLHVSSFGPNDDQHLEVRWRPSEASENVNFFRCSLRRSGLSSVLETREIVTYGNASRNVHVFDAVELLYATAIYTVHVDEVDFDGNTIASATAAVTVVGQSRVSVRNVSSSLIVDEATGHTRSHIIVDVRLASPDVNAFHFSLTNGRGEVVAEGIEHSTRHSFTTLNVLAEDAGDEFAIVVSEVGGHVGRGGGRFVPELIAAKVQLKVRGFRHPSPEDLEIVVSHLGRSVVVMREGRLSGSRLRFGSPPDSTSSTTGRHDSDDEGAASADFGFSPMRAFDYVFDDASLGANLARGKMTAQSSTKFQGYSAKAVDGDVDGHFALGSTTHTALERAPWWEIDLENSESIRTIRLWGRQYEAPVDSVARVEIYSDYSLQGTFTLDVTYGGMTRRTEAIPCDAVAMIQDETTLTGASLQRRLLEAVSVPGEIHVKSLSPDGAALIDHNFVRQWLVTFSVNDHTERAGSRMGAPSLSAPLPESATGLIHPSSSVEVVTLRSLLFRKGTRASDRQKDTGGDGIYAYNKEARFEQQSAMWPLWIFMYGGSDRSTIDVAQSFEDAMESADHAFRVDGDVLSEVGVSVVTSGRETVVTFPLRLARYVRVQLEPRDYQHAGAVRGANQTRSGARYLSLAEVEIFKTRANLLAFYRGGSPIRPGHYTPEESLDTAFSNLTNGGPRVLSIRDSKVSADAGRESSFFSTSSLSSFNGKGSLDDWQLLVTDQFGIEHIYYTDVQAAVTKLPNFGTLHRVNAALPTEPSTERGERLTAVPGQHVGRRSCFEDDCSYRFSVGANKNAQRSHAEAAWNPLLAERLVVYVPNENFVGVDTFSYALRVGAAGTFGVGTVTVKVKKCRRLEFETDASFSSSMDIVSGEASTFCDDDTGDDFVLQNWESTTSSTGLASRLLGVSSTLPHPLDYVPSAPNPTFYNPDCVGACSAMANIGRTHGSIGTAPAQPTYYSTHRN